MILHKRRLWCLWQISCLTIYCAQCNVYYFTQHTIYGTLALLMHCKFGHNQCRGRARTVPKQCLQVAVDRVEFWIRRSFKFWNPEDGRIASNKSNSPRMCRGRARTLWKQCLQVAADRVQFKLAVQCFAQKDSLQYLLCRIAQKDSFFSSHT